MEHKKEYRFKIDAYSPDTIPMSRLAEYMLAFAELLGERENVHFSKLVRGSTQIVVKAEHEAVPKVESRLTLVRAGDAPEDAAKSFKKLNQLLKEDNASGSLRAGKVKILQFPGIKEAKPISIGPVKQVGSIDGYLVRLGGKDATVPGLIVDDSGNYFRCNTTLPVARELKEHLLEQVVIRVYGIGKWQRSVEGVWALEEFIIKSFEVLDNAPLSSVVDALRKLPGNEWIEMDDPFAYLHQLRHGKDLH